MSAIYTGQDGSAIYNLNASNVNSGVLKDDFGGTGVQGPGAEGNTIQSVGGQLTSKKALYLLSATGVDLTTTGFKSLFTIPSACNAFIPVHYQIYINSSSAVIASASAVFSLSGVYTVDTNTYLNPSSGTFINKSISSSTGIVANTLVQLNVTTGANASICSASIFATGYVI